jgi:hypothetical protein
MIEFSCSAKSSFKTNIVSAKNKQCEAPLICLVTEEVVQAAKYSLCAYQAGNKVTARFKSRNSSSFIAKEECLKSTTEIKRLRFSSP